MSEMDRTTLAARLRHLLEHEGEPPTPLTRLFRDERELLRQAADALDALAWQDISTAPQNKDVLVWCSHGQYVACLDERIHGTGIFGWSVDDNKHGPYALRGASPTHWQPLPPAPATDTREREK